MRAIRRFLIYLTTLCYYNKTKYDEERQNFLLSKMKKLKLPNSGHAYEDFVIERVKKVKGGEVWILGS